MISLRSIYEALLTVWPVPFYLQWTNGVADFLTAFFNFFGLNIRIVGF